MRLYSYVSSQMNFTFFIFSANPSGFTHTGYMASLRHELQFILQSMLQILTF